MANCLSCHAGIFVVPLEKRLLYPKEYLEAIDAGYCSVDCHRRGITMRENK